MPFYDYRCQTCHHKFERLQPITADRTLPCEKCGKEAIRIITKTDFVFIGRKGENIIYKSPMKDAT